MEKHPPHDLRLSTYAGQFMKEIDRYLQLPQEHRRPAIYEKLEGCRSAVQNLIDSLPPIEEARNLRLECLEINPRGKNALQKAGYHSLGDVLDAGLFTLLHRTTGVAGKTVSDLQSITDKYGLEFE